ncbi:MAG: hypothetical protein PHR77_07515 [Kiritimatiellae bacterium]|nr:hypothetical protein [Kiritimatiellia bacterium]MDD5521761.1 hypothetical protein [Kiritimatiellia bacterium]
MMGINHICGKQQAAFRGEAGKCLLRPGSSRGFTTSGIVTGSAAYAYTAAEPKPRRHRKIHIPFLRPIRATKCRLRFPFRADAEKEGKNLPTFIMYSHAMTSFSVDSCRIAISEFPHTSVK